jgi:hypothetical protein
MKRSNPFLILVIGSKLLLVKQPLHGPDFSDTGDLHDVFSQGYRTLGRASIGPHILQFNTDILLSDLRRCCCAFASGYRRRARAHACRAAAALRFRRSSSRRHPCRSYWGAVSSEGNLTRSDFEERKDAGWRGPYSVKRSEMMTADLRAYRYIAIFIKYSYKT